VVAKPPFSEGGALQFMDAPESPATRQLLVRKFPNIEKHAEIFDSARSKESWLAIEPKFGFDTNAPNGSGLFGFRFLMVMAYISFRPPQE